MSLVEGSIGVDLCTICYNDGPGFDPSLMYPDQDTGLMTPCSNLKDTLPFLELLGPVANICPIIQKIAYDHCGCEEAPAEASSDCPVCYDNGPGFDETLEFTGEGGELESCANLQFGTIIAAGNPALCSIIQLSAHENCGCSTKPDFSENSSCPICYENGDGFDETIEFEDEDGNIVFCSQLQFATLDPNLDPFRCTQVQQATNLFCGCETRPAAPQGSCPVCYENGPGFDATLEFEGEDGETVSCSLLEFALADPTLDPTACTQIQQATNLYCGCETEPPAPQGSCPVCYNNGPGFDPSLEFVGDEEELVSCSLLEFALVDPDLDPATCTQIQLAANLFCGCSTIPGDVEPCNTGPDGKPFSDLEKVPPTGAFFAPPEIFDGVRTCGFLSDRVGFFDEANDDGEKDEGDGPLTTCEILVGYCADGPTCDICPDGVNSDNIVDEDGTTCGDAILAFDGFVMSEFTCGKVQAEANKSNCCKTADNDSSESDSDESDSDESDSDSSLKKSSKKFSKKFSKKSSKKAKKSHKKSSKKSKKSYQV